LFLPLLLVFFPVFQLASSLGNRKARLIPRKTVDELTYV
jgi:hypothetical protein